MFARKICTSLVAASLIAVPVQRAQANDAAALLGGALLGGIIVNEVHKNNQRKRATTTTTTRKRTYRSGISSAQRAENRQVQTALNYFGYNVGVVDGALGRNSRAGISRYQAEMGFQPDGYLDTHEKDFLLGSYQRSLASSSVPPYNQVVATQGYGGLLRTYRNEQLGIATPQMGNNIQTAAMQTPLPAPVPAPIAAPAPVVAPAPVPVAPTPAPTPVPALAPAAVQPAPVTARADTGALPQFTFGQASRSVNEHCNEINVLTAANGGITTAGRVSDAELALNEQFCLARTHAMAESNTIVSTIANMTEQQITQQCEGLAQAVAPQVAALGSSTPDQVIADTAAFLQGANLSMDQLASSGKVCLGVGYRTNNASMALASALLLVGAGQKGYAELVSDHMREGFGIAKTSPQQSAAWMNVALDALANGGTAVLGQSSDRVAVLRDAMQGGSSASGAVSALPVFPSLSNN